MGRVDFLSKKVTTFHGYLSHPLSTVPLDIHIFFYSVVSLQYMVAEFHAPLQEVGLTTKFSYQSSQMEMEIHD